MGCGKTVGIVSPRHAADPANHKNLHRPLCASDDLDDAFAWKEERTLSRALTLQYDKVIFILEPVEPAKAAIGKRLAKARVVGCHEGGQKGVPFGQGACTREPQLPRFREGRLLTSRSCKVSCARSTRPFAWLELA